MKNLNIFWGKEYLKLQMYKYKSVSWRLYNMPPKKTLEEWEYTKPNCKIISKEPFKNIVLFENNDVYRYYFEDGKTKWLFLYSALPKSQIYESKSEV
jgi:hypothetical protein